MNCNELYIDYLASTDVFSMTIYLTHEQGKISTYLCPLICSSINSCIFL